MNIEVVQGDLLKQDVDVIVNAANTHLEHMGGIAGLISRAAGPELQRESRRVRPIATGGAIGTTAGELPFKAVIHAVGPIWEGGNLLEPELLRAAHLSSLEQATVMGVDSVAFPAISCGIFGYPVDLAAPIAIGAARDWLADGSDLHVRFVLFSDEHMAAYMNAFQTASV